MVSQIGDTIGRKIQKKWFFLTGRLARLGGNRKKNKVDFLIEINLSGIFLLSGIRFGPSLGNLILLLKKGPK